MIRGLSLLGFSRLALVFGSALLSSVAQQPPGSEPPDSSRFKIISERNIFDPNRSVRVVRTDASEPAKQPVIQSFTLLGTMSYEKGEFAIFGGSDSQFRKVLKMSDQIAGFSITAIEANQVQMEKAGNTVELRVGMGMKRQDEGAWETTTDTPRAASQPKESDSSSADSTKKGDPAPAGEESDILKRLLERRRQEMQK